MKGLNEEMSKGTITLLNGTVLECYPLEHPEAMVDNEMKLDTTGTYLIVGRSKPKQVAAPKTDEKRENEKKIFLNNAFLFLRKRDRIMSDSRMFLCPVPIQSGLAYMGTGGFNRPTLGVYLEWWLSCESALICDEGVTNRVVYHIAGSPLSGMNHCGVVDENGKTETETIYPFPPLWSSFMRINRRYDEAKSLYQAFTLEQVVEMLEKESPTLIEDKELENLFLKSTLCKREADLAVEINRLKNMVESLKFQLFYAHRDELKAIMAVHEDKKQKKDKREKEIDEKCQELRIKLKSGEIDNRQYQWQLTPLKKEKENNDYLLREYRRSALDDVFPDLGFTIKDVEEFFKDPRSSGPLKTKWGCF